MLSLPPPLKCKTRPTSPNPQTSPSHDNERATCGLGTNELHVSPDWITHSDKIRPLLKDCRIRSVAMQSLIPLHVSQQLFLLKTGRRLREGEHRTTSWPPLALCRELDPDDNLNRSNECVGGGEVCVCVCVCVRRGRARRRLTDGLAEAYQLICLEQHCSHLDLPVQLAAIHAHKSSLQIRCQKPLPVSNHLTVSCSVLYLSTAEAEAQCSLSVEMFRWWEPVLTCARDWT